MPRHVRKGDRVKVIAGAFKGRVGEVMRVDPKDDKVYVKGLNLQTKHIRPTQMNPQGGVVTREGPIHISNVMPVTDGDVPTRVRFETKSDGSKHRVAVKDGKVLNQVRGPRSGG